MGDYENWAEAPPPYTPQTPPPYTPQTPPPQASVISTPPQASFAGIANDIRTGIVPVSYFWFLIPFAVVFIMIMAFCILEVKIDFSEDIHSVECDERYDPEYTGRKYDNMGRDIRPKIKENCKDVYYSGWIKLAALLAGSGLVGLIIGGGIYRSRWKVANPKTAMSLSLAGQVSDMLKR